MNGPDDSGAPPTSFLSHTNKSEVEVQIEQQFANQKLLLSWPVITTATLLLSFLLTLILPSLHAEGAWPCVDLVVIFNLVLDGTALLPQLDLINGLSKKGVFGRTKATSKASNFVGLLCLGRVFRMIFWAVVFVENFGEHTSLFTFLVPDALHTLVMVNFLCSWLRRVKKETLDPWMMTHGLDGLVMDL